MPSNGNRQSHIPVLLEQFLTYFQEINLEIFLDGTLGLGGHTEAILKEHPEIKLAIGLDRDEEALARASQRLKPFGSRFLGIKANFKEMTQVLQQEGISDVDGAILDVGVSSMQLDEKSRGFSFMGNGPLDMRMDQQQALTAKVLLNEFSEQELGDVFREYGELRPWRKVAAAIVEKRKHKLFESAEDLSNALMPVLGKKRGKLHPLTLVYQALRIAVNDELGALQEVLPQAIRLLRPGGRLGVISFHSLEDRIVKNGFKEASGRVPTDMTLPQGEGIVQKRLIPQVKLLTKKPLIATRLEIKQNPRARSAKMRFVEKIDGQ